MSIPEDSFDLTPFKVEVPKFSLIVYGRGMELPAFTLERSIINLRSQVIKTVPLPEMIFLESPYAEEGQVIAFINDENEMREFLDNAWSLGVRGDVMTCGNAKSKGDIAVHSFAGDLCEIRLSISLLNSILGGGKRDNRLSKELDFSDLSEFISMKSSEISQELPQFIISPVLYPSKYFLEKFTGKTVKGYFDVTFQDSNVIYTEVDAMPMRRIAFSLRKEGKKVKEVKINVDPLLAPIYLSLIAHYIKVG
ncbi:MULTISPECIES: hypothetical protein [Acidianus]|uniref:hypothetical protein n=1 Tax=Acidianus TaxID=12914 RepID=UPI001237344F|nr:MULTISPECIES: hypothetical protein [Acidianus]NON63667.1 hypothetical protein [Acidianus sp. RZ1]